MKTSPGFTRRQFMGSALASAGATLLPVWGHALDRSSPSREVVSWKIRPFPMPDVRLLDSPFKSGLEANAKYLHLLPNDRLLHTFRVTAGIASSAQPLGGWESPKSELRGHLVGGHYLSACALTYSMAGDDELKSKANELVAELAKCQKANGNGYLSAYPTEFFDRLRNEQRVWAPYYTMHKIMAGHLDMYQHCGNEQALETAENMAGWVQQWAQPLSDEKMQRILQTEFGGMSESLANLYGLTGKSQYLDLAHRFEKWMFFDPLAARRDELKGIHANTHIPQVIAAARRYELTGDHRYHEIANYFLNEVTSERCYCSGGTSNGEYWGSEPGKLGDQLSPTTAEDCCSYNMMKLARHVYGWTGDPRWMDYYERTLINARLGTMDAEGLTMYYYPLATGYSKTFGKPFDSFWCCTGTGMEEFSKFGDSIYFQDDAGLYVNLFIASELNWRQKGLRLKQTTRLPEEQGTTLTVQAERPTQLALNIRVPYWVTNGMAVKLNGEPLAASSSPGSYLILNRRWKTGDKVEVSLPMSLRSEALAGDSSQQAVMFGPVVLGGLLGKKETAPEANQGQFRSRPKPAEAPEIAADGKPGAEWVEPVPNQSLAFRTVGQKETINLTPLYAILDDKYAVYWKMKQDERGL